MRKRRLEPSDSRREQQSVKQAKIRLWVGIISLAVVWVLYSTYDIKSNLIDILMACFSLYTLVVYIILPYKKIRNHRKDS